jgi:UDP-N-acetylmuramoyl-tripeptide--D-alanyl-D-alanine ligase
MLPLTLNEIAQATNGTLINAGTQQIVVNNVSTDSRTIAADCLFIALQGERFDAHQFIKQVEEAEAVALLIHKQVDTKLPCILVKDTRIALGLLATFVKQKIGALKCAAITGSNGKTTTKELLSQILRQFDKSDGAVLATAGNFNNDIGLPLTLLRLTEKSRFAVVELGANHPGEIAYTAQLAKPDVALINNVLPAHLEGFGSLEGGAKAKGEIWSTIAANGYAVVNLDANFAQQYLQQLAQLDVNILTFSQKEQDANLFASNVRFDQSGRAIFTLNISQDDLQLATDIHLSLPGKHNISNALAAAAMAWALGCNLDLIRRGLNSVKPVPGRVNYTQVNELLTVIDDTYNANSASVKAAIDLLAQCDGTHLLILGDMGELGLYSEQEHTAIGHYAAEQNIEQLFTVGKLTQQTSQAFKQRSNNNAQHFSSKQQLLASLQSMLLQSSKKLTILVKGSRTAKMEEVVNYIKQL